MHFRLSCLKPAAFIILQTTYKISYPNNLTNIMDDRYFPCPSLSCQQSSLKITIFKSIICIREIFSSLRLSLIIFYTFFKTFLGNNVIFFSSTTHCQKCYSIEKLFTKKGNLKKKHNNKIPSKRTRVWS